MAIVINNAGPSVTLGVVRGASFSLNLTIASDGGPLDLTGCTVAAAVLGVVSFTVTIDDPASGTVTLSLTPVQTTSLPSTPTTPWDCKITYPSGRVDSLVRGVVVAVD